MFSVERVHQYKLDATTARVAAAPMALTNVAPEAAASTVAATVSLRLYTSPARAVVPSQAFVPQATVLMSA